MKEFIGGNVAARYRATSKDEQKAFKTMSISVFGRCLMNPIKYNQQSTIISSKNKFLKAVRDPRFKRYIPLREDRVLCISDKPEVTVNFPSFIGFQILELAKYKLYHFWYKVIKKHYKEKAQLIYTDTDSYIFLLEVPDLFAEYSKYPLNKYMDFSNFSPSHPLYNNDKKV